MAAIPEPAEMRTPAEPIGNPARRHRSKNQAPVPEKLSATAADHEQPGQPLPAQGIQNLGNPRAGAPDQNLLYPHFKSF
ncbi:hypothetical protein CPT03_15620 [Pedobacter ginsengisoli]|uniref:Uncharacterized protein n=1 Tax=Pedobacter ginsengisoli TaxID=363852 RepID=A0A2D1U869_9SPHI|nr:hypothetical protein CPT03_15620 [Pedobacter ginsengisoli]